MRKFQTTLVEVFSSLVLVAAMLFVVASLIMGNCSDDTSEAIRSLETNGFTQNTIIDSGVLGSFHGCGNNDSMWYEASSTNPIGKKVNVMVCCGGPLSFKGCTIRVK